MSKDSDIFVDVGGTEKKAKADDDIFVDVKQDAPAPVQAAPVETKTLSPKEEVAKAGVAAFKAKPWGEGANKLANEIGGKVTDLTGSPLLGAIISVLPEAAQMAIGGEVGKVAKPAMEGTAKFLMSSAAKPTLDQVKKGKAAPAIETMLKEGLNPTAGGVEKAKSLIDDLGTEVNEAIAKSGAQIDVHAVADYVPQAYARFKNGPLAVPAADDLGKVQTALLEQPNIAGARTIPVQVAQDMKSGYQKAVGDKGYGELKTPETEGWKQVARGFREKIGEAVPSVVDPLARESAVINALKIMERRVAVDANKNPIGLGWLAQPWMLPFWMWDRSAAAKGLTARALYSGSEAIPGGVGAAGGALYGATQPEGVLRR